MAIPDVPAAQPGSSKASRDKVLLPPKGRYQIKELLKAPGRLIHPGRHIEEELEKLEQHSLRAHGEKFDQFKGVTAGKVSRSAISTRGTGDEESIGSRAVD